ncbi:MAG: hypothetical protein IJ387_03565 [Thermoguttaceae bacterium]|nr:hypothetical protein [Thermoguttaceae bacterium]
MKNRNNLGLDEISARIGFNLTPIAFFEIRRLTRRSAVARAFYEDLRQEAYLAATTLERRLASHSFDEKRTGFFAYCVKTFRYWYFAKLREWTSRPPSEYAEVAENVSTVVASLRAVDKCRLVKELATPRERETLDLLERGLNQNQIAALEGTTRQTINNRLARLRRRVERAVAEFDAAERRRQAEERKTES